MKKRMIWVVCLVLIAALTVMPAMAAGSVSASLSADRSSASTGSTVTFTVYAEVDSCGSGGVEVSYDSSVFEMVSGSCTLGGTDLAYFDTSTKDGAFAFANATAVSGSVFQFALKVKDSAPAGSHTVSVTFAADGISDSSSATVTLACDHTYDNSCDEICNLCGVTREVTHTWDSGTVTTGSTCSKEGVKTFKCTGCGKTRTETMEKASHDYSGKVTKEPTCAEEGENTYTCSACGDSYTEAVETLPHNYEVTGYAPATCLARGEMTFTCVDCGWSYDDYIEQRDHSYDNDCDTDCNTCGETRSTEHEYGETWQNDASGHWQLCEVCGVATDPLPHTPGPEPTETEDQTCLDCGFVLQVAGTHIHVEGGNWLSNGEKHWYMCTCGGLMGEEAHDWVLEADRSNDQRQIYRCSICRRTKHVTAETTVPEETTAPTETTTPPTTQAPTETTAPVAELPVGWKINWWWVIGLAVGIPVLGIGGYIIIGLIVGYSKKGKYDSKKR